MCQDSESVVVDRPSIRYPSPCIEVSKGGNDGLPRLPGGCDTGTGACHGVGVAPVPLPPVPAHLQRADGNALQPPAGPDRHRPPRRPGAAPGHAQPARPRGGVPHARLHLYARDRPGVGGAVRPLADGTFTGEEAWQGWRTVALRCDLHPGGGALVLRVAGHRRQREPGGLDAQ